MSLWFRLGLFVLAMMLVLFILVQRELSIPLGMLLLLVSFGLIRLILGPVDLRWMQGHTAVTPDDSADTPDD